MFAVKLLVSIILFSNLAYSQHNDSNKDTLFYNKFSIIVKDAKTYKNKEIRDLTYFRSSNDTLYFGRETGVKEFGIASKDVQRIKFKDGNNFMKGFAMGGLYGFGAGMGIYYLLGGGQFKASSENPGGMIFGLLLAVPGAIIGGIMGANDINYKYYDLSKHNTEERKDRIRKILKENY